MAGERKVYPVSVVNRYVKQVLEQQDVLQDIWVGGEISNFKRHSSGHLYFTLKDAVGAINAVMFSSDARRLRFLPENGKRVQARGMVTLYEKTGGYQLYIRQMEAEGVGDLYQAFEELKQKLMEEGLFDQERKKVIPAFPRKVGIVTSPTGAAVRDIIQIAKRRYPGVSLVLYPALVQGSEAAPTIVKGIRTLDKMDEVDVVIVGRGGGSMEDLWPFNEEIVARAIADCHTPVISAVGHETDFTIADFVSDLRAPTPSAAAELAVPDITEILGRIQAEAYRRDTLVRRMIQTNKARLDMLHAKLVKNSPEEKIRIWMQTADLLNERMDRSLDLFLERNRAKLDRLKNVLELASPLFPLEKGYAMIQTKDGNIVTGISELQCGDDLTITMKDGLVTTEIKTIESRALYE